jgi:hypothetical protein
MKKKTYKTMNAIENGNTVDFWEWYYKGKFKENVSFFSAGKKDYITEIAKHYNELLEHKAISISNLNHENRTYRESAQALLNQLTAIENILKVA